MIIAQLTDLHIGFDGQGVTCKNTIRLEQVFSEIKAMRRQPDVLLLTGDLVEHGANWAYESLRRSLAKIDIPFHFALGNHDDRDAFSSVFPSAEFNDGFLQYSLDDYPLRIIVIDSLEIGKHGGGFCETRARWLSNELSKFPDRPTLIALHHPPISTGIGWMTAREDDAWVTRLKRVVSQHSQIVQIISGHIHRSIFKSFANTHVSVASAVAPQLALELAEIDPGVPDGRPLIKDDPAGYSLHQWDGTSLTTHSALAPAGASLVIFDEPHAFIVRHTLDLPPKE